MGGFGIDPQGHHGFARIYLTKIRGLCTAGRKSYFGVNLRPEYPLPMWSLIPNDLQDKAPQNTDCKELIFDIFESTGLSKCPAWRAPAGPAGRSRVFRVEVFKEPVGPALGGQDQSGIFESLCQGSGSRGNVARAKDRLRRVSATSEGRVSSQSAGTLTCLHIRCRGEM